MLGFFEDLVQRNLVRAPGIFHRLAVYEFRPGPALGRAHNQHRPRRPLDGFTLGHSFPRDLLNFGNAVEDFVEDCRGLLVHRQRIIALQRERLIAVAAHQAFQLGVRNSRQHRRVGNLVAVQMKDGQHGTIGRGIEKLVRVPARSQRPGLGLAVAHHTSHNQIRIVECRAVGVNQRVAQFAAFVDRARRFRCHVAGNSVRPTELPEQPLDAVPVLLDVGIDFGVRTLQVGVGHQSRPAVPRPDDVHHVQVALANQPVPVHIKEVEPWRGAPVAQQSRLHVVQGQRPLQHRVVFQIDLANGEIVGRAPVGVHLGQQFRAQGTFAHNFAHFAPRKGNFA